MTEERKTSSTGGQKGQKLARFDLIAFTWLWEVATVCGFGAKKYDDDNWRKGYSWRLSYGAMQRHLSQFWTGENYDEESGLHHLAHAAWHCMVLFVFSTVERYKVFDDRPDTINYKYGPDVEKPRATGCCAPSIYSDTQEERVVDYYGVGEAVKVNPLDEYQAASQEIQGREYEIIRTECLLGHKIEFINEDEGYIDNVKKQGTAFRQQVQLYRDGYHYIDDKLAEEYRKANECKEQPATS